jgi:hypothetical protein
MNCRCHICGCEIYLSLDEFLDVEQSIDEECFCDDCAENIIDGVTQMLMVDGAACLLGERQQFENN